MNAAATALLLVALGLPSFAQTTKPRPAPVISPEMKADHSANLNRDAWVGSFSGVPPEEAVGKAVLAAAAGTNARLRLLWIGCGQDDFLRPRNEEFIAKLKEAGIVHQWNLTQGGHSWPVWRG